MHTLIDVAKMDVLLKCGWPAADLTGTDAIIDETLSVICRIVENIDDLNSRAERLGLYLYRLISADFLDGENKQDRESGDRSAKSLVWKTVASWLACQLAFEQILRRTVLITDKARVA